MHSIYVCTHQRIFLKEKMKNLPEGNVIFFLDFTEEKDSLVFVFLIFRESGSGTPASGPRYLGG